MTTDTPIETDVLCENCGYRLNGLPEDGNCPECGAAVGLSISPQRRFPPAWEQTGPDSQGQTASAVDRFLITTAELIFRPTNFYRTLNARGEVAPARRFARIHWVLCALIFGLGAWLHTRWYWDNVLRPAHQPSWVLPLLLIVWPIVVYLCIVAIVQIAARLTAWEAAYRSYRLPLRVVLRALYYHSAHTLPVALCVLATIAIYTLGRARGEFSLTSSVGYLYVLAAEVPLAAGYLFHTYWIGMRNLLYANR